MKQLSIEQRTVVVKHHLKSDRSTWPYKSGHRSKVIVGTVLKF